MIRWKLDEESERTLAFLIIRFEKVGEDLALMEV